ncbi:MAG: serine/threonine-protein phosphatase, partial [Desulfobacterales bacterium]|nr:serine/threonine-protein phosphatase [Desulfobacterales bacterium]
ETIRDYMQRVEEAGEAEEPEDADESLSKEANRLPSSIQLANRGVFHISSSKEKYKGMGATLSAAYFTDEALIVANVGDSPIYLIHNGSIELLSVIHNVISEQTAIDPEAAEKIGAQYRNLLTRAMGIEETVLPDISEIPYFQGDKLVICSDGLSDLVKPDEILDIIINEKSENVCKILVDLANNRGGHDNITVITLTVKSMKHQSSGILGAISWLMSPLKKLLN